MSRGSTGALLEKEKAFTRARDAMTREQRALPWEAITRDYVFDGPRGRETLGDLFDGRAQLVVYHFMFAPTGARVARIVRSGWTTSTA